ncbi:MAG: GDSL-type esterase/lipase family protein [Candidatus Bathyarchaeota archaeon]|nr:GDSL-type esterase/lipase family protein [Candidatus Bathyarchaeota archaeon]
MDRDVRRKKTALAFGLIALLAVSCIAMLNFAICNLPRPIRVACVGDSITVGGYPLYLQDMLGFGYQIKNFGVCGATVSQNSTIPYMNQPEFKKALEFDPDIVVVMLGTNDANPEITYCGENFVSDYEQLIQSFQSLKGQEQIWIVKSPPIFSDNSAYNNTYLSQTVLPQIDTLANQLNLPTIDVNSVCANYSDYFGDGVHPNSDGASLIAENVYEAITLPDGSPAYMYYESAYYD